MLDRMAALTLTALVALATSAVIPARAQDAMQAAPSLDTLPPPSSALIGPDSDGPHAVLHGHHLQPAVATRSNPATIRETLAGIDQLLRSDEQIAGRNSRITEPRDLYGNEIGGNPGLAPIVDPAIDN